MLRSCCASARTTPFKRRCSAAALTLPSPPILRRRPASSSPTTTLSTLSSALWTVFLCSVRSTSMYAAMRSPQGTCTRCATARSFSAQPQILADALDASCCAPRASRLSARRRRKMSKRCSRSACRAWARASVRKIYCKQRSRPSSSRSCTFSPLPQCVVSHLLWLSQALVSVECALRIHPHRPRADQIRIISAARRMSAGGLHFTLWPRAAAG